VSLLSLIDNQSVSFTTGVWCIALHEMVILLLEKAVQTVHFDSHLKLTLKVPETVGPSIASAL
jgi:hypothetical protein